MPKSGKITVGLLFPEPPPTAEGSVQLPGQLHVSDVPEVPQHTSTRPDARDNGTPPPLFVSRDHPQRDPDPDPGVPWSNDQLSYQLPYELASYRKAWWDISAAAKAWGCTYNTARRWIKLNPHVSQAIRLHRPNGSVTWHWCVPAGTKKTAAHIGNPCFQDSRFQRTMAHRRWDREREREKEERERRGIAVW